MESKNPRVIFSKCFSRKRKVHRRSCWSLRGLTAEEIGVSPLSGQKCHFTQRTGYWAAQNATVSLKSHLQGEQPNGEKLGREDSNGTLMAYMCGQVIYLQKMDVRLTHVYWEIKDSKPDGRAHPHGNRAGLPLTELP